jgi:hypothetical protein
MPGRANDVVPRYGQRVLPAPAPVLRYTLIGGHNVCLGGTRVAKAKGKIKRKASPAEKPQGLSTVQAAEELGVSAGWIRSQIAAGAVTPARASEKPNARYLLSDADIETLRGVAAQDPSAGGSAALARLSTLESERANLLAQVAWERAIAQEQQKALEAERTRTERLSADLELQRSRIEALKALSAWDRVLGRHKAI